MSLFRSILFALCIFAVSVASAADDTAWYMQNTVADRGPGIAGLCSGSFNLVIKQPQEEEDCDGFFDVLFYADLKTRKVYWSKSAVKKVDAPDYKRTVVAVLKNQMRAGGSQTLDQMREFYLGSESAGADQAGVKPREVSPTVQAGRPSKRIRLTQEMLGLRCPEDIESDDERKRESLKFSRLVMAEYYRLFLASSVSETDVAQYQREFYEIRGCKKTIAALEASEAADHAKYEKVREEQENQRKQRAASMNQKPVNNPPPNPDSLIEFRTAYAEQKVRGYRFACPQPGKSASLMDALRLGILEASYMGGGVRKLYATVDSRGDEIRIYHQIRGTDGFVGPSNVVMTLDKWGELKLNGITKEALINNLCYR